MICRRIDEVRIKLGVVLLIDDTSPSPHMLHHMNAALVPGHQAGYMLINLRARVSVALLLLVKTYNRQCYAGGSTSL